MKGNTTLKRKIYFSVVTLIVISILGIILIQGYLLKEVYAKEKENFRFAMERSIQEVAKQIEELDSLKAKAASDKLGDSINDFLTSESQGKLYFEKYLEQEDAYFVYTENFTTQQYKLPYNLDVNRELTDTTGFEITKNKIDASYGLVDRKNRPTREHVSEHLNDPQVYTPDDNSYTPSNSDANTQRIVDTYTDVVNTSRSIEDWLTAEEVFTMIQRQTHPYDIDSTMIGFVISYGDELTPIQQNMDEIDQEENIVFETTLSTHQSRIASHTRKPYSLGVYLPPPRKYMMAEVGFITFISIILVVFVLITFGFVFYYLFLEARISRMRRQFIANITHEFKTPLAAINLAVTMIEAQTKSTPDISPNVEKYLSVIKDSASRSLKHVDLILNISRLQQKKLQLKKEETNVVDLIKKSIEEMRIIVEQQRLGSITLEDRTTHPHYSVDVFYFQNVITNLLDNANKYSPDKPQISVSVYNEDDMLVISVSDEGKGISPAAMTNIFDNFYREVRGDIHDVKGYGLGLSFVKRIIDMHNSKIYVESELKKGSIFTIKLDQTLRAT